MPSARAQECNDEVNGILNETLSVSGQLLVKLFGREKAEYDRYEEANGRMIKLRIREQMAGRWFFMLLSTLTTIGPMLLYLVGGILIMKYDSNLSVGDIITYTTVYGTRTYSVSFVGTIAYTDWSHLQATSDNRITLTTCLADHPSNRVCVQAVEVV